jgi:RNA-directed DNA polymerase
MKVSCSTTRLSENLTDKELAGLWENFPWAKAHGFVDRLQKRIAKAVKEGKHRRAKRLQYLLTHSFFAKALAVRKVIGNRGKRTCGVDGVRWTLPHQRAKAIISLTDKGYRAKPLARVYIPKSNSDKMRPLSIPTFHDRAMQALHAMALQPWAETTADRTSFGFRPNRSAHDAAEYLFNCLSKRTSATHILEGDIKGFFDNISHEWLLRNIPMDKKILKEFLEAGYLLEGAYHDTRTGTPQGGLVSPTLANMALDGMESLLKSRFKGKKVHLTRYADDWVVTTESKKMAEEVKSVLETFLAERGLSLAEEKTRITHIDEGFDFLGWNFRKYCGKLLIKPSGNAVGRVTQSISTIIKKAKGWSQESLIAKLNPVIRGWTLYHRNAVSSETFSRMNFIVWGMLWHWAKRRHPNKVNQWIARKYWHSVDNSKWTFTTFTSTLHHFTDTKIRRHVLIQLDKNPYLDDEYFARRISGNKTRQSTINSFFNSALTSGL